MCSSDLASAKSVAASLKVNVSVAVSSAFSAALELVILTVGSIVSTLMESGVAALLLLPEASVNVPVATSMVPLATLSSVGVKVAVYFSVSPSQRDRGGPCQEKFGP